MPKLVSKLEHLTKAQHSLGFALDDLREANKGATAVESIVLLDLIKATADLENRVAQVRTAIAETPKA